MPSLFCIALKPALVEIQSRLKGTDLVVAYLDDVYVICAPENARYSYDLCAEVLEEFCGIKVNLGKLAAWSPTFSLPPPSIADLGVNVWKSNLPMHERGITIVGTPFGCQEYMDNVGLKKLGEEAKLISSVLKLPSIQVAWLLLYFCIVPKINHLLRTLSPASVENIASLHDNRVLDTFRFLFCIPNEDAWDIRLQRIYFNSWIFKPSSHFDLVDVDYVIQFAFRMLHIGPVGLMLCP